MQKRISKQAKKSDTITIVIEGTKRIRQEVVDTLYFDLMVDDPSYIDRLPIRISKDTKVTFSSTLEPSEGVM
jgi:hypothetical protein